MRRELPALPLAVQLFIGAAVLIVAAAAVSVYVIFGTATQVYLADRGASMVLRANQNAQRIGERIDALRRDVLFLSRVPPVQGLSAAIRNGGSDPVEGRPVAFWRLRLEETFSALVEARPDYFQVQFIGIDDDGRELVHIDAGETGRPLVVPSARLQSSGDRDYFQASLTLPAGDVHISDIDLNREQGGNAVPPVRPLRAVTPIFAPDGARFGMIVISMNVGPLLDSVATGLPPGIEAFVSNERGDFLVHPDPALTFGIDRGQRHARQQTLPALRVPPVSGGVAQRPLQAVRSTSGLLHVAVERVAFDPRHPGRYLLLAYALPDAFVEARLADVRNTVLGTTLVIVLVFGALVFFLLRHTLSPLTRLTAVAREIGAGRYEVALPGATAGEMGVFVQAFRAMRDAVRQRETEILESHRTLQASEARLATVLENLVEGVAVFDLDGRVLHFNRAAMQMHGFESVAALPAHLSTFMELFELALPDGTRLAMNAWPLPRILRGERLHEEEIRIRRVDTDWQRTFSYGGALARDAAGHALLAVVTVRDVTERRQAEDRIRTQVQHLMLLDHITRAAGERQDMKSILQTVIRSLEQSLPVDFVCVLLCDSPGGAMKVASVGGNTAALGHEIAAGEPVRFDPDDNDLGRCIAGDVIHERDIGRLPHPLMRTLAGYGLRAVVLAPLRSESSVFGILLTARRDPRGFSSGECEFLRQLAEHVALAAHQARLHGALQQAYDDLRQTQQVVMQEERLRALGQMASGIAHDINNALSPVSLYTEAMLETEQNLSDRSRRYLETIQRAVEDVAHTVARMREFYRQRDQQLELAPVDLNRMVQQVLDLTRPRWSDQPLRNGIVIHTRTELAPDLPLVMGVESEIREALTNLVFNAVDAMPGGGTLTLRTRIAAGEAAESITVEVSDTGVGMDENTRRRCQEPFFTTKGERGTGLGLAMVYGMAQRHSAELEIDSAPGAGTTLRIRFAAPATDTASAGAPAVEPAPPSRLRLLLVDDDPVLLKSLSDALQTDGHVITMANGGEAGIAAFRRELEAGGRFAAVLTDLGMPHVDGRKVAAAVKELSPATPVIMLTGWGARLVAENDIPEHVDRVLAKPPKLRDVRAALAELCGNLRAVPPP
jgi:PAS domain S-box-containing protein